MLSQAVSTFPMVWMTCIGLLLFMGVFIGVLAWVHRRGSAELYQKLAAAPLAEEEKC
jgi:cbb3-type cytochrome oxidase subunit 3